MRRSCMMGESSNEVSEIKEKTLDNFSLDNFEGPLDLLLFLIQKEEVAIEDVQLQKVTEQFASKVEQTEIDQGSHWLALAATLLLLKSQKLIPGEEELDDEELPRMEVFQKLLEYCQIKEAADMLVKQEDKQRLFFSRGRSEQPERSSSGLEEVGLEELTLLLRDVLEKAPKSGIIQNEVWEVGPKIEQLRLIKRQLFSELFLPELCKEELIVTFLALLELMKLEELRVVYDGEIYVESTGS